MAVFNKYETFTTDMAAGTHAAILNSDVDTVKIALTNTAPVATHTVLANIVEIAPGFGYVAGGEDCLNAASTASGVITVVGTDVVWTAAGGPIAQFRYCVIYNSSQAGGPLIGWWDTGSAQDILDTQTFTANFGANMFTVGL